MPSRVESPRGSKLSLSPEEQRSFTAKMAFWQNKISSNDNPVALVKNKLVLTFSR